MKFLFIPIEGWILFRLALPFRHTLQTLTLLDEAIILHIKSRYSLDVDPAE